MTTEKSRPRRLDVVNLRVGGISEPSEGSIEEPLTVLAELKRQGLIRHIGLSNITPKQLAEAQNITEIVCVQNFYNVAARTMTPSSMNSRRRASPMCHSSRWEASLRCSRRRLTAAAAVTGRHADAGRARVASPALPNILLIPGTSSVAHLRENLKAARFRSLLKYSLISTQSVESWGSVAAQSFMPQDSGGIYESICYRCYGVYRIHHRSGLINAGHQVLGLARSDAVPIFDRRRGRGASRES